MLISISTAVCGLLESPLHTIPHKAKQSGEKYPQKEKRYPQTYRAVARVPGTCVVNKMNPLVL